MSAITLPRQPGETDDSFKRRALEDSEAQAAKARDKGVAIHSAVQGSFEGLTTSTEFFPHITAVRAWIAQRYGLDGWEAEKSFAHMHGYGGKADLRNRSAQITLDVKCKEFGEDKQAKELAWPEHVMQLAAYSHAQGFTKPNCANVFVSTSVPGLVVVREWDDDEIAKGWEAFQLLLRLWQIRRDYYPSFSAVEIAA